VLSRATLRIVAAWLTASLVLHLVWEIAQLLLYTIYREASRGYIAFAVAH
jgi:hypothetical protein